jgi:hypothetical protein
LSSVLSLRVKHKSPWANVLLCAVDITVGKLLENYDLAQGNQYPFMDTQIMLTCAQRQILSCTWWIPDPMVPFRVNHRSLSALPLKGPRRQAQMPSLMLAGWLKPKS